MPGAAVVSNLQHMCWKCCQMLRSIATREVWNTEALWETTSSNLPEVQLRLLPDT